MENKSVKINCSFCGKEIECPENMLNAEKHACFECFEKEAGKMSRKEVMRLHVDMPMGKANEIVENYMLSMVMEGAFPDFWKDENEKLKNMSRKDAISYAFGSGANTMLGLIKRMDEEAERREKSKSNPR